MAAYKGIGGGLYKNTKAGSKRKGMTFRMGPGGTHVYKIKGKKVVIGKGKKKPAPSTDPALKFDPLKPLSGKDFRSELNAALSLNYAPQERELASARRSSDQAITNTGSWFDQYAAAVKGSQDRQAANSAAAVKATTDRADASASQDNAALQAAKAQADAQAAKRGTTSASAVDATQAAASRRASADSAANLQRAAGSANDRYMGNRHATAFQQKGEALGAERSRRVAIDAKGADLAREKGAFSVDFRNKQRAAEREYALARSEFEASLQKLLSQESVASTYADAKKKASENARKGAEAQADAKKNARTRVDNHYYGTGGGKGSGRQKGTKVPANEGGRNHRSFNKMVNAIRKKQIVREGNPFLIAASKEWYKNERKGQRGVSPKTARILLRDYGFRVPTVKPKPKALW